MACAAFQTLLEMVWTAQVLLGLLGLPGLSLRQWTMDWPCVVHLSQVDTLEMSSLPCLDQAQGATPLGCSGERCDEGPSAACTPGVLEDGLGDLPEDIFVLCPPGPVAAVLAGSAGSVPQGVGTACQEALGCVSFL